ncbi:MAG: hypothetical protein ABI209_01745 [Edaphobacter sp.]
MADEERAWFALKWKRDAAVNNGEISCGYLRNTSVTVEHSQAVHATLTSMDFSVETNLPSTMGVENKGRRVR